jgi:glycosyltransferase A (GT-A) superfamily protein (DUF2064 family)
MKKQVGGALESNHAIQTVLGFEESYCSRKWQPGLTQDHLQNAGLGLQNNKWVLDLLKGGTYLIGFQNLF